MMAMQSRSQSGFTMLELLIGVALGAVMLATLSAVFLASSRTNAVVGQAVQNQTSIRGFLSSMDKEIHNSVALRVTQDNTVSGYSSTLDIRTRDGRCVRWRAEETNPLAIIVTRREVVGGPVAVSTPPDANFKSPSSLSLLSGASHFFAAPYTSLAAAQGVKYTAMAGTGGQATLVASSVYPAIPSSASSPCW